MNRLLRKIFILTTSLLSMTVLAQSQNAIGFKYDVQVSNPQAAVAAIDKYRRVAAGSGDDVTVTLYQYLANGTNPATHAIVVSYASPQVMDATLAAQSVSSEWAVFQSELGRVSQLIGSTMWRSLGLGVGNADLQYSQTAAENWVFVDVEDREMYATAWQKWVDAEGADDKYFRLIAIAADGTGGATHALINISESVGAQFDSQNDPAALSRFRQEVREIREIKEHVRLVKVKAW